MVHDKFHQKQTEGIPEKLAALLKHDPLDNLLTLEYR